MEIWIDKQAALKGSLHFCRKEKGTMKRMILWLIAVMISFCYSINVFAVGEGNVDGGGGGMGSGTSSNMWIPGEDGVRVTVVSAVDNSQVSGSFDISNKVMTRVVYNFGLHSKLQYRAGLGLAPQAGNYAVVKPTIQIPKIVPSSSGGASIAEIKRYFCSEYIAVLIANQTGIEYEKLINGNYKVLIEPIAYFLFNSNYFAMTATEAALYDQILSGGLRAKMVSLTHKNLPLSMFLERPDLGYAAWNGTTTQKVSNDTIINYLGLGVVKYTEDEIYTGTDIGTPVGERLLTYTYRTDTDVITSISINADREYNPDNPLTARFVVGMQNYIVRNIVIPENESQLVWIKWHTPNTPQNISIRVTVGGRIQNIIAKVEELNESEPPDPKANERNDTFSTPAIPSEAQTPTLSWGVWSAAWHKYWVWSADWEWTGSRWVDNGQWVDNGWYDFTFNRYSASIKPGTKVPTAAGLTMKSGYGFSTEITATTDTDAPVNAFTQAQTGTMKFPEFEYQTYFRVFDRDISVYQTLFRFRENRYSTFKSRTHFTPIWYPDGTYTVFSKIYDAWTPAGMLSLNNTPSLSISGNMFSDWHIAPKNIQQTKE